MQPTRNHDDHANFHQLICRRRRVLKHCWVVGTVLKTKTYRRHLPPAHISIPIAWLWDSTDSRRTRIGSSFTHGQLGWAVTGISMFTVATYLQTTTPSSELAAIARKIVRRTARASKDHDELVRKKNGWEQKQQQKQNKKNAPSPIPSPIFPGLI